MRADNRAPGHDTTQPGRPENWHGQAVLGGTAVPPWHDRAMVAGPELSRLRFFGLFNPFFLQFWGLLPGPRLNLLRAFFRVELGVGLE